MATLRGGQVDGTPDDDVIFGEGQDFLLRGKDGDDTIIGPDKEGPGDLGLDGTIAGGQGDDAILIHGGDVSIDGGGGDDDVEIDRLYPDDAVTIDGGAGHDTLLVSFYVDLTDSSFSGFERLELDGVARFREDQIVDGTGANLFEIGRARQNVQFSVTVDGDRMNLSQLMLDWVPADHALTIQLVGSVAADTLVGTSYGDGLFGLGGDDRLYGGDGNDGFSGGRGDDTLIGGDGDDRFDGDDGQDRLVGGAGDDQLTGGLGADVMIGGEGDDFYFVDDAGDVVHDGAGRGTDRVQSLISYTLGKDIENLFLGGPNAIDGTGNAAANDIFGNGQANAINGGGGADTLNGWLGADTLTGGAGGGRDVFAFSAKLGPVNVDRITDFGAGDRLQLSSSVFVGLEVGALAPEAFVIGTQAQDADDRIVYDTATGSLFFDRDGAGGERAIRFAILDGAPELTADDFSIV